MFLIGTLTPPLKTALEGYKTILTSLETADMSDWTQVQVFFARDASGSLGRDASALC